MRSYHEEFSNGNANPGPGKSAVNVVQATTGRARDKEGARLSRLGALCSTGRVAHRREAHGGVGRGGCT